MAGPFRTMKLMSDTPFSDPADDTAGSASQPMPSPGSRLMVERFEDGLMITIPAPGMTGSLLAMFLGGVVCDVLGTIFLASMLVKWAAGGGKLDLGELMGAFVFFAFFGGAGLALILTSLNVAKRKAALAVTDGLLMALQTGLFGSKQREWQPGEVLDVRVGPSGIEINNKPVMELQIVDTHGRKFSMLAGHREEDLDWLAHELRQSLKLPDHASDDEIDAMVDEDEEDDEDKDV